MGNDDFGDDPPVPEEIRFPIEDHLDLHAFSPRDVRAVVESYLEAALSAGFVEVRIIHGRGIGAQRQTVRAMLERHPEVITFHDAPPERGGWGATVVQFRPRAV